MKRTRIILYLVILFLLNHLLVEAQKAPIKWGKIDESELQMTSYELDTQANALVLCDYATYSFDFGTDEELYRVDRHRRIKVLTRAGFNEGNVVIPYYKHTGMTISVKAQVIQPDGTKIEIKKKEMFDEQVYESRYNKRIAFPNLQEGSIIEYQYKYASPYLHRLPTWYFQEDIPVKHSELRVIMPEVFTYAKMVQGHESMASSDTKRRPINTRLGTLDGEHSTYIAKDVPALKPEPHITTMHDYMMRIKFQLKAINIPGSYHKTFMTNWNAVATELLDWDIFGGQYLKNRLSKDLIAAANPIMEKASNEQEKLAAAYTYLANTVAWDGSYDYTCDQNINKSFEAKKANSAELSFMLIALLRANGVQAFPVLTSTRNYGKMFPIYPFRDQFNHVLVCAVVGEKLTLIDTPQKNRPLDLLNVQSLNRRGLVISDAKRAEWVDIKPSNQRNVMMANLKFGEEGALTGDIQCNLNGYSALAERRAAQGDKKGDFWVSRLEDHAVEASVSNIEYENLDAIYKPFKEKVECELSDLAQVVDDFIYITPVFYSEYSETPFKLEKRSFPVDFAHPINEQTIVNLEIPEGYTVEDLPDAVNLSMPDGGGKFLFTFSQPKENMVQVVMRIQVKKLMFLPTEYVALKNFFDIIAEKQQEQIVLKKV
ncbi:MAG: DUF3857 and transglutaminase domain-containing protein [Bacteroidota bacterium]